MLFILDEQTTKFPVSQNKNNAYFEQSLVTPMTSLTYQISMTQQFNSYAMSSYLRKLSNVGSVAATENHPINDYTKYEFPES